MLRTIAIVCLVAVAGQTAHAADAPPRSLDPRVAIKLFAEAPQIVTPTDVDVDHRGRVWAIESNTHFPPADYKGHPSDRILVFRDDDGDGQADQVQAKTFADGFVHAMSLAVRFQDGIFVATRKEVFCLADADGDGKADRRVVILRLETPGDYPHNGLAGFAFDGLGYLYIGLGENIGAPYRLVGADGRALSGGGEGGSVFRCRPDGSDLSLWATGFWNPHASCVDAFGRMFTVDNDPDDRPPCRLLSLIPGGDYGYRFRNGRRGIHPFTAWDGELPGTLPMVSGTGEAPSGIVAYESAALPSEYRGSLLATSWGDHRIDRFRVRPQGTSVTATIEPLIVGGKNFRPVGIALAPDGSLFVTDWVLRDYKVHGKGRIWRIGPKARIKRDVDDLAALANLPVRSLRQKLESPRLDVRRLAARFLAERHPRLLENVAGNVNAAPRSRFEASWALARRQKAPLALPSSPLHSSLKNAELPLLWPDLEPTAAQTTPAAILNGLQKAGELNPSVALVRLVRHFDRMVAHDRAFLEKVANLDDRFVFAAVVQALRDRWRQDESEHLLQLEKTASPRLRLALLLAARQSPSPRAAEPALELGFHDADPSVRRAAIQWIGEERKERFREGLVRQLSEAKTPALFEAVLASLDLLDGIRRPPRQEFSGADYALRLVRDERAPSEVRALALRMVPAGHKGLDVTLLKHLLGSTNPALREEALRTLSETNFSETPKILRGIADGHGAGAGARAGAGAGAAIRWQSEAIAGLGAVLERDDHDPATIDVLVRLAHDTDRALQIEALRALRRSLRIPKVRTALTAMAPRCRSASGDAVALRALADQLEVAFRTCGLSIPEDVTPIATRRPQSADDWIRLAGSGGDAETGRRLFAHACAGGCSRCHTVNGRGGRIGPDLTTVARAMNRRKLAESIVRPSREIAPQFATWTFQTRSGRTVAGRIVAEDREGRIQIGTTEGAIVELGAADVEERHPQNTSVMPEKLVDRLTPGEFRDLVAFLATLK